MRRLSSQVYGIGALVAATLSVPALLGDSALSLYVLLALTATVTVGVSLLMGHAGQVSLGQGAFYACGAYAAGLLSTHGCPGLVALLAAPLAAATLSVVVGVPLLKLRGHYLAFATLATHLICLSAIGELRTLTGGDIGLQGIPRLSVGPLELDSDRYYAVLAWAALWTVILTARNILASRPGRALRALSTSEVAAASSGVPVGRYKLAVFALSAGFAGLAGGIYAFYLGYLAPGSFPVLLSIEYVVMAVVGGLGTISGGLVGSAIVVMLVQVLTRVATASGMPSTAPAIFSYAVYAVLLILAVLFLPDGVVPVLVAVWTRLRERRPSAAARERRSRSRERGPPV